MTGRDNKERGDATVYPPPAKARADVPTPAIWHRLYFSSYLLWAAQHEAELAGQIEAAHVGSSRFSIEHRAHVLSSIVASVGFLEAMANELYQDAVDGHSADAYVTPLPAECRQAMAHFWRASGFGRSVETIEKYERLLEFAGAARLDRGGQLYEDVRLVITVRNIIVHYLPENLSDAAEAHDMERRFRTKRYDVRRAYRDPDVVFPLRTLRRCVQQGRVRALAPNAYSVMGYVTQYDEFLEVTAPAIVGMLQRDGVDLALLVPA
jgi:hypothetical protein